MSQATGISTQYNQNPLDYIYHILFHPFAVFRDIADKDEASQDIDLLVAVVLALFISVATTLASPGVSDWPINLMPFVITLAFRLFSWFFVVFTFALTGFVFSKPFFLRKLMILSGFSLAPWLFVPILKIMPGLFGPPGQVFAVLCLTGLGVWTTVLFIAALRYTYKLTTEQLIALAVLPFLMMCIGSGWLSGFFVSLLQWSIAQVI